MKRADRSSESAIRLEDYPREFRHMAELLGNDLTMELLNHVGGTLVYFPSAERVRIKSRNRNIRQEFRDGASYNTLSEKWRLTTRQIRKIIDGN